MGSLLAYALIIMTNQDQIMIEKGEIESVLARDPVMAGIMGQVELDWAMPPEKDVYLSLLRSIVSQQLSVKAANTIYHRFLGLFGEDGYPHPGDLLALAPENLRSKGLSKQKAGYLRNIADYFSQAAQQDVDWSALPNEDIIRRLTSIKGVGRWTTEMVLMFSLRRPDVFPVDDLGIRQGMGKFYKIEAVKKRDFTRRMEEIAEQWKPYRSYACRYIWAAKDKG
jgi:DNA-3-methyladenine glycosylase II